jgi:hypothetical protein
MQAIERGVEVNDLPLTELQSFSSLIDQSVV